MQILLRRYGLYLACIVIGFLLAQIGCGDSTPVVQTRVIDTPEPKIEYVDRWKTDSVRFVQTNVLHDTVFLNDTTYQVRLDTLYDVDTVKIVETWLTELAKYDTSVAFDGFDIRLSWENYQNRTENLRIAYTPQPTRKGLGIMMYAKGGLSSDFQSVYRPSVGAGLLFQKNRFIFGADYTYLGEHNINGVLGYKIQ